MKINRRNFFRLLGVGAAAAAVTVSGLPVTAAPVVPSPIDSAEDTDLLFAQFVEGHNDVLCYRLFTPHSTGEKLLLVLYRHGADAIVVQNIHSGLKS